MANNKKKKKSLNSTVVGVSQKEITQLHGEAASQLIQSYKGVRYDTEGKNLFHQGRNLKGISKYKTNAENEYSNLKQQSGFSGELLKESKDNKSAILNKKMERTRTTDGIGRTNDQKYDHVKVDGNNKVIAGSESQMKMNGRYLTEKEIEASSEKIVKKMMSDKWSKYSERPMDIPAEQVEHATKYAREEAEKLRNKAQEFKLDGDIDKAKLLELKAKKYEETENNIRNSNVTSKESMEARVNPKKYVTREVLKDSHNAGIEAAKGASILSFTITSAQNMYEVVFNEKDMDEAISDIAKTAGESALVGYAVGNSGTVIKSIMHTSKNSTVRILGKTNAPAMMATGIVEVGKSIKRYSKGEINEEELLEELGEKGTGMVAASYGSAVGTIVMPGVGTVIGGMIGYTISSLLYQDSLLALKEARISQERRMILEKMNQEAIKEMKDYREKLKRLSRKEYQRKEMFFENIFNNIDNSVINNDIQGFFDSINRLGEVFNIDLQFKTFEEFDDFMKDDETILKL